MNAALPISALNMQGAIMYQDHSNVNVSQATVVMDDSAQVSI